MVNPLIWYEYFAFPNMNTRLTLVDGEHAVVALEDSVVLLILFAKEQSDLEQPIYGNR